MSYACWFRSTAGFDPHPWQLQLGEASACTDRVLRIDTTAVHVLARFVISLGGAAGAARCLDEPLRGEVERVALELLALPQRGPGPARAESGADRLRHPPPENLSPANDRVLVVARNTARDLPRRLRRIEEGKG